MASRKNNPKSDAASWVLIVVLFLVGLWPIALAVLLFKLFGKDGQKRRMPPPLEQQEPAGSIPTPVKKRGTGPVTPVKRRNRAQTAGAESDTDAWRQRPPLLGCSRLSEWSLPW